MGSCGTVIRRRLADGHIWMLILSSSRKQSNGHGRRDTDRELEGSVMKLAQRASGPIMYINMDWSDLQFSAQTVMSTIAEPLEISKSPFWKIAWYLEDKPVLDYVYAYQNEVGECMALQNSDWARDRETRRSSTAVLEKQFHAPKQ